MDYVIHVAVPTSLFVSEHWLLKACPYRIRATLRLTLWRFIYTSLEITLCRAVQRLIGHGVRQCRRDVRSTATSMKPMCRHKNKPSWNQLSTLLMLWNKPKMKSEGPTIVYIPGRRQVHEQKTTSFPPNCIKNDSWYTLVKFYWPQFDQNADRDMYRTFRSHYFVQVRQKFRNPWIHQK